MKAGKVEAVEFEDKRHGTPALIANFEVATGKVISFSVGDPRTEADFTAPILATVNTDPEGEWIVVCDQLNTHKSATLLTTIAQLCGINENLGEKGKSGIFKPCPPAPRF